VQPGDLLSGRFRLTDPPIGAGQTGVVWPAIDEASGRSVAVKVVHPHLAEDPDTRARLGAAAGLAGSRVAHRALVESFGVFADGGSWFLVMERVDGASLDGRSGEMAPAEVAVLGEALAGALAALHAAGRVHGDVRPGNVLLGRGGPKLIDSGFGRAIGSEMALAGRPGQTAPEVLAGAPPRPGGDLYGLGVVLYRALSGQMPWTGPTPWAVLGAQKRGPPPRPPGPAGLGALVALLLDPDPSRRPPDAASVRSALRRLRRDPSRPVDVGRRWIPPIRALRSWLVHGSEPESGAPVVIRVNLRKGAARDLAARLRREGWTARAAKEAWDLGDLAWMAAGAGVGWALVPLVGSLVGGIGVGAWRARLCRPELRTALPQVTAPLPPIVALPGAEEAVVAGLLLLGAAAALLIEPWVAWVLVGIVAALGVWTLRRTIPEEADRLARGRLATVLVETQRLIDHRPHPLDLALALEGELVAIERSCRVGEISLDEAITRAERVQGRARSQPVGP
jgi:hypothetical protein